MFFDGDAYELASRSDAGFLKEFLNDCLNGALGRLEVERDLFVGQAVEDATHYFALPRGQGSGGFRYAG